jgi:hypothetical protein
MKINKRKRSTYNKADIATIRIDNHEKLMSYHAKRNAC